MRSIQILHSSLLGYALTLYLRYYMTYFGQKNTNVTQGWRIIYKHKPNIYFIIKSGLLTSEKMNQFLKDIRKRSQQANIIIIGSHINYEELYQNHYRVYGVIDTTTNKSLSYIKNQIIFYLDGLCT